MHQPLWKITPHLKYLANTHFHSQQNGKAWFWQQNDQMQGSSSKEYKHFMYGSVCIAIEQDSTTLCAIMDKPHNELKMSLQVPEKQVTMQRNYHEYIDQDEIYNNIPSIGEAKVTWRYLHNFQGTPSRRAIDRRQALKYRRRAITLNYKSIQEWFEAYTRFVHTGDKLTIDSSSDMKNKKWTKAYVMYFKDKLALTKAKSKPIPCNERERLFKYCSKLTIINKTMSIFAQTDTGSRINTTMQSWTLNAACISKGSK